MATGRVEVGTFIFLLSSLTLYCVTARCVTVPHVTSHNSNSAGKQNLSVFLFLFFSNPAKFAFVGNNSKLT